jgi:Tfp pilus assembly protein PilX
MVTKNEKGVALILTLILLAVLSIMAVSLLFMARAETWSGMNYRLMTQARYGAEAGVQMAANFLQDSTSYTAPSWSSFTTTSSPVQYSGSEAALSANSSLGTSNFPVSSDITGFASKASGSITAGNTTVNYGARARLLAIQTFVSYPANTPGVVEKWEITSDGTINGVRNAQVRVSAIMERQKQAVFAYAAFADATDCQALQFGGGGTTNSYDSSTVSNAGTSSASVTFQNYGGNVGTNGNLTEKGNVTMIYGSLSSPRQGTGTCSGSNVTALTLNGAVQPSQGLVELPQNITYPTPDAPNPAPPTSSPMTVANNNPSCSGIPSCSLTNGNSEMVIIAGASSTGSNPAANATLLGDLTVKGTVHFTPPVGTAAGSNVYININTLTTNAGAVIVIDPIPGTTNQYANIILNVAGTGSTNPIDMNGNSNINNYSLNPSTFQILYAGTQNLTLNGGSESAALLYAPNASMKFAGNSDFYGAVIANKITDMGGASVHYDRRLQNQYYTPGQYMLSAFNWQKY